MGPPWPWQGHWSDVAAGSSSQVAARPSSFTNFAASGTHRVVFDGVAAQTASAFYVSATQQRFWDVEITNVAGVTFTTAIAVNNDLLNSGIWTVLSGTTTIGGLLTLQTGSTLNNSGIISAARCTNNNATINGTVPAGC